VGSDKLFYFLTTLAEGHQLTAQRAAQLKQKGRPPSMTALVAVPLARRKYDGGVV